MKLNKWIDHTKLGANVTLSQIDQLLLEAIQYDFKSVCVNPIWVKHAKQALKESTVLVCTVIGFPHGTHQPSIKKLEADQAVIDGADELDMVINVEALKSGDEHTVFEEIKGVLGSADGRVVKVIIETCYLSDAEIISACKISLKAGAHFVKTSTGFGTGGATIPHVKLMKQTVGDLALIKASGGVRTYEQAILMIEAGASRIGTSNGIDIVTKRSEQNDTNTTY